MQSVLGAYGQRAGREILPASSEADIYITRYIRVVPNKACNAHCQAPQRARLNPNLKTLVKAVSKFKGTLKERSYEDQTPNINPAPYNPTPIPTPIQNL